MVTLHHHPFCPHSRFVRLVLFERSLAFRLVEERFGQKRKEFLALSPEGATPLLVDETGAAVPGEDVIVAFLDETRPSPPGSPNLLPSDPHARVEARRLMRWFNGKMFHDSVRWILREKIERRFLTRDQGGGAPDMEVVHAARANLRHHLRYIGRLSAKRHWLAGEKLSYADFAAAAQLSCVDYLGDAPWDESQSAKDWYSRMKSRPGFRPILSERVPGLTPSATYADLDF